MHTRFFVAIGPMTVRRSIGSQLQIGATNWWKRPFLFTTRNYPGLLRQSLKFCEILSSYFENAVLSPGISLYIWDQNSKTKAIIRNPKTYRPSLWPTVTNGMSYSCLRSVSIKKRRYIEGCKIVKFATPPKFLYFQLMDRQNLSLPISLQILSLSLFLLWNKIVWNHTFLRNA